MTSHEQVAEEIAGEIRDTRSDTLRASVSCRQGDLVLVRLPDQAPDPVVCVDRVGGRMVVRGSHGEHRLMGLSGHVGDVLHLPDGGLMVHTDEPSGRHRPIELAPGCWSVRVQEELGIDMVVRKVVD
jgi:hypothetical protein